MERFWILSYFAALFLVIAQGLALAAMLRTVGSIHLKSGIETRTLITDDGPEIHSSLPEFEAYDLSGQLIQSNRYRGRDIVLLLLSPSCTACVTLLRDILPTRRGLRYCPDFFIVMEGTQAEAQSAAHRWNLPDLVAADPERVIRTRLGIERTPYGLLVDRAGTVRMKGVVNNRLQLESLIRRQGRHIGQAVWRETEAS